jgi:carboxypeptidase T
MATAGPGCIMPVMRRPVRPLPSFAAALVLVLLAGVSPARAATDFPKGYEAFHTYAEMVADIRAVQAAHPDIVQLFSIGRSYQGRELWAAKISDNVATDEPEPEVLYDGLHHSDEHMGLEMTLRILHWLADGYRTDTRVTNIVNSREIWIVFAVNPDGAEYDISGGRFHHWRKNRQPNAGTTAIGTDLNRNYGYRWGGGGLTSTNPRAITYRGASAFSTPEDRAMRDFLASRVVNGRQQIRTAISFHEYGRLVMWPYGYTHADVPADMTSQDHAALVAMGRHMAASNGYRAQQGSDLYVTSGTTRDYEYGVYRIFAYTFELSNVDYPKSAAIATETARNRDAILYLAERAGCPYAPLGVTVANARCGALDDDMEVARGWTVNPDGTDTAPSNARFVRADPAATSAGGVTLQPGSTASGRMAFVTGPAAGTGAGTNDLDGVTTVRSAPIALPAGAGQQLTFRFNFAHTASGTAADHLRAIVETATGTQTVVWERTGTGTVVASAWRTAALSMDRWAGQTIRIRFEALDGGADSTVEAGVDDVRVTRASS